MTPIIERCEARALLSGTPQGPLIPTVALYEDGWYYELRGDQKKVVKIGDTTHPPRDSAFEYLRSVQYATPEMVARGKAFAEESEARRLWELQVEREIAALQAGIDPMSVRPAKWGGYATSDAEPVPSLDILSSETDDSIFESLDL